MNSTRSSNNDDKYQTKSPTFFASSLNTQYKIQQKVSNFFLKKQTNKQKLKLKPIKKYKGSAYLCISETYSNKLQQKVE